MSDDYKTGDSSSLAAKAYIRASYVYPFYNPDYYRDSGSKLSWTANTAQYSYFDVTGETP